MTRRWIRSSAGILALLLVAAQPICADDGAEDTKPDGKAAAPPQADEAVAKATALRTRGDAHTEARRYKEAVADYQAAMRLLRGREQNHPEFSLTLNNLASVLEALGRASEALPLYEEALAMGRRLFSGDHPYVATSLNNLASVLEALGRASEALPLYEEALAMGRRLFSGDHPDVARSLNNLASVLEALGRASEALPLYEEALAMRRRLFSGDHPDVATSLNNLASVLEALGRASEALPLYEEALAMRRRLFSGDHPYVARSLNNLAHSLAALNRLEEARKMAEEAIHNGQRIRWPECYIPRVLLAELHLQQTNAKDALAALVPAAAQLEARRSEAASLGSEGRARYLAVLRRADPFPLMVRAHAALGNEHEALAVLERSRGREMLDLLRRGEGNPLQTARRVAQRQGGPGVAVAHREGVGRGQRRGFSGRRRRGGREASEKPRSSQDTGKGQTHVGTSPRSIRTRPSRPAVRDSRRAPGREAAGFDEGPGVAGRGRTHARLQSGNTLVCLRGVVGPRDGTFAANW